MHVNFADASIQDITGVGRVGGSHFERDHVQQCIVESVDSFRICAGSFIRLHHAPRPPYQGPQPSRQRLPPSSRRTQPFRPLQACPARLRCPFSVLAACSASTAAASMSSDRAGEGEGDRVASSAACEGAASLSSNSSIRSATRSNAALNAARGAVKEIRPQPASMALTWESKRSQIRPSAPISRHRKLISLITRALLRTGARFSSSARLSSAADAADLASSSARLMAVNASASPLSGAGCLWAARLLRSAPPHRAPCKCRHYGCAWHIHSGTSGPASLHEGLAHRLIIFLARQAGASGNRR